MGRIRDAINARRPRDAVSAPTFGAPADASDIASAEAALGLPLPDVLRELYGEFDGLWFGEPSGTPFHSARVGLDAYGSTCIETAIPSLKKSDGLPMTAVSTCTTSWPIHGKIV